MDSRQFKLGVFIVFAVCLVVGTIGYFMNNQAKINRGADVQRSHIEQSAKLERTELIQKAKLERTKERWGALPFLRDGKDKE